MSAERILTEDVAALDALVVLSEGLAGELTPLGDVEAVDPSAMPDAFRRLLVHTEHMTPTLKAYHGRAVELRVLAHQDGERWYRRKIVLTVGPNERTVEFGVVRLDLTTLDPDVGRSVLERRRPLGDILIDHGVMTRVEPQAYLRFGVDHAVTRCLAPSGSGGCYGRLATIHCDERPAIELLEVVTDAKTDSNEA